MKYILRFFLFFSVLGTHALAQCPFTTSAPSGCREDQFCFNTTVDPATVTSYSWNFGDGNMGGSSANVCHTYTNAPAGGQTYTVTLTVVDTAGATCNSTQTVTILPRTNLIGTVTPMDSCQLNLDSTAAATVTLFVIDSVIQGGSLPLTFDFGGGNTTTSSQFNATFTYDCFGSYPIKIFAPGQTCPSYVDTFRFYTDFVTAFNLSGTSSFFCEGDTIFAANNTNPLCGNIDNYLWDWNLKDINGNITVPGPVYTVDDTSQQFNVYSLDGIDLCNANTQDLQGFISLQGQNGCYNHISQTLATIIPSPRASIDLPDTLCTTASSFLATPYNFSCPQSFLVEPVNYFWDFGNGVTSNLVNPFISYVNDGPGTYVVTLTVSNPCNTSVTTDTIIVIDPPTAEIIPDTTNTCAPNGCINFTNLSQPDSIPATYTWSVFPSGTHTFGNGTNAGSREPTICFNQSGTYTVQMRVDNFCGFAIDDTVITVNLAPDIDLGPVADTCGTFTLTSLPYNLTPNGSNPLNPQWTTTGDIGTFAGDSIPTVTFAAGQTHEIILTFDSDCGIRSDTTRFFVDSIPDVQAFAPTLTLCASDPIFTLTATPDSGTWIGPGVDSLNGNWRFDPGIGNGTYTLVYIYEGPSCFAYDTVAVTVIPVPNPIARADTALCEDSSIAVQLTATPLGGSWVAIDSAIVLQGDTAFVADTAGTWLFVYELPDAVTGCIGRDTTAITVFPLPAAEIDPTIGDTLLFCQTTVPQELPNTSPPVNAPLIRWEGAPNIVLDSLLIPTLVDTFDLQFVVETSDGCIDRDTITVTVVSPQPAEAGPGDTLCINAGLFSLTGASPGNGIWSGPGLVDPITGTFDPLLMGSGPHTVFYTFAQGTSCEAVDSAIVLIEDTLNASITNLPPVICEDFGTFTLVGNPTGGLWFGNGLLNPGTSNGEYDPNLIPSGGADTIQYIITNPANGCVTTLTETVLIDSLPTASFDILPDTAVCIGDVLNINNTSFYATGFEWDFGDGTGSTLPNPVKVYSDTGTFIIQLIVTSPNGCTDTTTRQVNISEPPVPDFLTLINGQPGDSGCAVLTVCFQDQSNPAGGSYLWDFGNGQTDTTANPPCVNYAGGIGDTVYTVTLTIVNRCDSVSISRDIAVSPLPRAVFAPDSTSAGCSVFCVDLVNVSTGAPFAYNWYLDTVSTDSLFFTGATPPQQCYSYEDSTGFRIYEVFMVAENACGTDTGVTEITVFPNTLDAQFNTSPIRGCEPLTVDFLDLSGAPNISWAIFRDGVLLANPTGTNPTFTFDSAGIYQVLHGANDLCSFDTNSIEIIVDPQPVAAFVASDTIICLGDTVFFTNQSLTSGGFNWDFGDSTGSNLVDPFHVFTSVDTFTVSLTAFADTNSCARTISRQIIVRPLPDPGFILSDTLVCPGTPITATATTPGLFYQWSFGGTNYTGSSATHTFSVPGTYNIRLNISGVCANDSSTTVEIAPTPTSNFTLDADSLCGGNSVVTLTNNSTSNTTGSPAYLWYVGDTLQTTNVLNPSFQLDSTGTFTIGLETENIFGCRDTLEQNVTLLPQPVANLQVGDTADCVPFGVGFTDLSTGNSSRLWEIDGQFFSGPVVFYTYTTPDIMDTVVLIVDTANFCFDTVTQVIQTASFPTAAFAPDQTQFCDTPATVNFTNFTQSTLPFTSAWTFGDTNGSTDNDPTHTYEDIGHFEVTLTVTNDFGCEDQTIDSIFVYPQPQAIIETDTSSGCVPLDVVFTSLSTGNSSQLWRIEGNIFSTNPQAYTYNTPDILDTVWLVVDTANFCFDSTSVVIQTASLPQAEMVVPSDTFCGIPGIATFGNLSSATLPLTYAWDFGDNNTSTAFTPTHTYQSVDIFTVTLTVTNSLGCTATDVDSVQVYPVPQADIISDRLNGCVPLDVLFTQNATDADGYTWLIDGQVLTGPSVPYTFLAPDQAFDVIMIADTAGKCSDTASIRIETATPPLARFTSLWTEICDAPAQNDFTQLSQSTRPITYNWDFGDGETSVLASPAHIFDLTGSYEVQLTIENDFACIDSFSQTVSVYPQPEATFIADKYRGCIPDMEVAFTNQSTGFSSSMWNFGDNSPEEFTTDAVHEYTTVDGAFTVTLIVDTADFCFDTATTTILTASPPQASFVPSLNEACGEAEVALDNTSSSAVLSLDYLWDFGNGDAPSTSVNPTVNYEGPGTYEITLIATNDYECIDSASETVTIFPQPTAIFEVGDRFCLGDEVLLSDQSLNGTQQSWEIFREGVRIGAFTGAEASFTVQDTGAYTVRLVSSFDDRCQDELVLDPAFEVFTRAVADFTARDTLILEDCDGSVFFENTSRFADSYLWDFGDASTPSVLSDPLHTYLSLDFGFYNVTLIANNPQACPDTVKKVVRPCAFGALYFPTAFQPEGGTQPVDPNSWCPDDPNDIIGDLPGDAFTIFLPIGRGIRNVHVEVFDKWGSLMWKVNTWEGDEAICNGVFATWWDGRLPSGELAASDVYVWRLIEVEYQDGQKESKQGTVTLIR
ncbi:MAG: PKD domain-containing protein [Bacteroidota bacterium]